MKLASRIAGVAPSATLAMTARAKALRAQGADVLNFAAGEPDFDTPDNIKTAAKAALDRGETKYTPVAGSVALRAVIAEVESRTYGRTFAPEQVIVGAGGKQVLFNACVCLLEEGDEAVILAPYWVSYPDMVRFAGGTPLFVPPASGERLLASPEQLARALSNKTQLVFINSPSNPSGATYTRDELRAFADILRGYPDVFIITDDMYGNLVYDAPFVSIAHVAPDLAERTLIVNAVSKTYAMTGWRVGWGVGPEALIKAITRVQGASTSGASSIAQAAATEALSGDQSAAVAMREVFKKRRDRMVSNLRQIPDVTVSPPGGAFYVFPRVSAYYGGQVRSSQALCEHLLDSVHVAAVPGEAFGADEHIRLSFACSEETIDEGVRRIGAALKALRGAA